MDHKLWFLLIFKAPRGFWSILNYRRMRAFQEDRLPIYGPLENTEDHFKSREDSVRRR